MFDGLLKSIYNKIATIKDKKKKSEAIKKLDEKILSNKFYKHQFANLTILRESKDKKKAVELIEKRNNALKATGTCCCEVKKENQKLAEFFNINPLEIKKTGLDEVLFKETKKVTKKDLIKEKYNSILKTKSKKDLHNQLKIINFYAESINSSSINKDFIINSLLKLRHMSKTNLTESIKKTYKLRLIAEKLIKENAVGFKPQVGRHYDILAWLSPSKPLNPSVATPEMDTQNQKIKNGEEGFYWLKDVIFEGKEDADSYFFKTEDGSEQVVFKNELKNSIRNAEPMGEGELMEGKKKLKEFQKDDDGGFAGQTSPGKRVSLKDLDYIKKIQVEVPYNYKAPEKVVISFIIPFYPQGTQLSDLVGETKRIKKSVDRLERIFINKFIYGKGRDDVFQPNGTIWDGSMRENLIKAGYMVKYSLDIYINVNPNANITWDKLYKEVYQILKEFNHYLEAVFPTELSRAAQKEFLANNKKLARKTKYKKRKDDELQLTSELTDDFGGMF